MITLTTEQAQLIEDALDTAYGLAESGRAEHKYATALATIRAARAHEQAEQEPVGRWNWNEAKFEWLTKFDYYKHHMTPLYAAPVRTKDLTDVDLWNLWEKSDSNIAFARAVIAADREKNK